MPRSAAKTAPTTAIAIGDFAASTLVQRLKVVIKNLRKAIRAGHKATEPIHQLRVASRRAQAAIELFAAFISPKQAIWFRRQLRKLRKLADEARNSDVLRARVKAIPPALDKKLRQARRAAKPLLVEREEKLSAAKKWNKHIRRLVAPLTEKPRSAGVGRPTAAEFAAQSLRPHVAKFTAALAIRKPSPAQLHQLRIAGKHLRYALEMLSPLLGASPCRTVLSTLKRMQDELGAINDHATALKLFASLRRTASSDDKAWLRKQSRLESAAIASQRIQFLEHWPPIKRRHLAQLCLQLTSPATTKSKRPSKRKKRAKRRLRSKSGSR